MAPVEIWTGSDDGLTQRLADAVEGAMIEHLDGSISLTVEALTVEE